MWSLQGRKPRHQLTPWLPNMRILHLSMDLKCSTCQSKVPPKESIIHVLLYVANYFCRPWGAIKVAHTVKFDLLALSRCFQSKFWLCCDTCTENSNLDVYVLKDKPWTISVRVQTVRQNGKEFSNLGLLDSLLALFGAQCIFLQCLNIHMLIFCHPILKIG